MTSPSTAPDLRAWLATRLSAICALDAGSIDIRERFSRYGLDSLRATSLMAELAGLLGRPLPPTLVWEYPTIEALAGYLGGETAASAPIVQPAAGFDAREPIAIVGMACRFPQAPDLDAYWRLLAGGVDAITEAPRDRWDAGALFDADPAAPGKLSTRWGGFLEQVDGFDPHFFGISPREAMQIDPQQRLVLELSWEALEDAGVPPRSLLDSRTGVFMGAMWTDYASLRGGDLGAITQHTATGQDTSIIPARVSYHLGLRGPCMVVNTACSSSLVAVHLARQSLLSGECALAIAGGVNLLLSPESTVAMSKFGAMAPDGRSKAFDARANGYVRGEGGGVVILERLSRAIALGHPIHAILRGSAVNNDGFSNGLTAPSPKAQELVLRDACASAGVEPARVDYVEAHGTGTMLGDPIEAGALGVVFGEGRPAERPLVIGSVKTNIGHLEAAAGMAGLIKVVLAMRHRAIPASLHFERPNPHIAFEALRLRVPAALGPWPEGSGPALAGVSSFGFGGTNCHVIVEGPPGDGAAPGAAAAAVAGPEADADADADADAEAEAGRGERVRPVFVFAGQGSQWRGMGRALLRDEPAFRASLARSDRVMQPYLGVSLLALLAGDDEAWLEDTALVQPAIFAVQVGLADLLRAYGIEPAAVVGQSMGEVAAALVAGCLSLEDAARIICARSRIVKQARGQGGMAVVELSLEEAGRALEGRAGLSVAVSTSPSQTVLSGDEAALDALLAELERGGVFCRRIKVDYASHGPQMDPLREELSAALLGVRPRRGGVPFCSTVTGAIEDGAGLDAAYWWRNLREPVLFTRAVARLLEGGHGVFLDLDSHPLLTRAIEQCAAHAGREARALPLMHRDEDDRALLREALGALGALGAGQGRQERQGEPLLLALSAHSEEALAERLRSTAAFLRERPEVGLADVCYTAGARRSHLERRAAFVVEGREEALAALDAGARGEAPPGATIVAALPAGRRGVVFVFPGQGSQWLGMGRKLLAEEPAFRAAMEVCDEAIARESGFSVLEELAAGEERSRLSEIDVVQPVLFAIEVALAALWRAWGVEPAAVVGHSMGEVAAAHVAGILSLADAARVICRRSRLLRRVSGKGAMGLVELTLPEAEAALAGYEDRLSVAVSNGPRSTVLSGDPAALEEVLAALEERGVFCRRVKVDVASHSPQMDPLLEELRALLAEIRPLPGRIPMRSTVTGEVARGEALDAGYWARNLRAPVLFSGAIEALAEEGHALFVELSPHPILVPAVEENLRGRAAEGAAIASVRRGSDERRAMREALCALWARGVEVDWEALFPAGGRVVPLPAYPWQRERCWLDVDAAAAGPRGARSAAGDVRSAAARDPLSDCVYDVVWRRCDLSVEAAPRAHTVEPAPWLVLRDAHGTGAALARTLRACGEACVEIGPAQLPDLTRLLPSACRGVVHCGSLDAAPWEETDPATLEADLRRGTLAAVVLAQAVLRRAFRDPPRLFLVTRGAQAVGEGAISAAQAPLWGMARAVALEHPELECTRIDLPSPPRPDEGELLARELLAGDGEEQIALRAEGRFVARLARSRLDAAAPSGSAGEPPAPPAALVAGGTYLITGGLGGLGLSLAGWMVEAGARHLVLVGRSAPGEAALAAIRAMEEAGAEVRVMQADVSRAADVERVAGEIRATLPPLRGVVHAAGIATRGLLSDLGEEQLMAAMRPKVLGAWALHEATRGMPLDFFVMYSSISSVLGSPGMAAYGAANAFLDALAHARAREGLPATSIQWGPFADVGMAVKHDSAGFRQAVQGVESFTPREGTELFARLLARPRPEVGLFRLSLRRWIESTPQAAGMRFFSELPVEQPGPKETGTASFREALAEAPPPDRAALLEAHVIEQLGRVLRLAPSRLDRRAPFKSLGLDSLMSLEARNLLEKSLGLRLPATLFFTYPDAPRLSAHLLERMELPSALAAPRRLEIAEPAHVGPAAEARREREPLAIVGMSCRFPGGGDSPEAYWRLLERGVDAVREIPPERWPSDAIPGDRPEVRRAALLDRVDGFDAAFFGISPREAEILDPQQRLLLEVAWEALEDAGQPPDALSGAAVGVFVGLIWLDYQHRLIRRGTEDLDAYAITGNMCSTAGGRISYTFGFQGPCVSVDTACSSSLVSVALACQSLRAGECDVALAGGVNLLLSPFSMAMAAGLQALSPDGRCKTLDARANGFVRGEGAGLVVLKRLSDALRDGDSIRALIPGWAVNQDGRSTGLTAPNVLSQQALLRAALGHARVSPDEIGYVEMHGTGTPLGDPIEMDAIREVLGKPREGGSTCALGAVKTNLGHLEAAAGVAGLLKAVLALEHESIPQNLHFRQLNPRISLDGTPFVVPTERVPWRRSEKRRVAGVSGFGLSGTNAHVVVTEAPAAAPREPAPERSAELVVLSARSEAALSAQAARLGEHLGAHPELGLGDVALSLATTRSHLPFRLAVSATSRDGLRAALEAASQGQTPAGAARGRIEDGGAPRVVFVFPGQGGQWLGMGRQLLAEEPAFRAAIEACDQAIRAEAGWSVLAELAADPEVSRLGHIDVVQPVLFAVEVALSALWRSWGVEPDAVVGHSMGEVAAAHVAGALSLEDAAAVICRRSLLLRRISGQGEMAMVELPLAEAEAALRGYEDRLSVAVSNGPRATVLSGEPLALAEVMSALEARGVFCRRVKVDVASHSPQVDPLRADLCAALDGVGPQRAALPMRSTVTGAVIDGPELVAGYWSDNLRRPVRFAQAVEALLAEGHGLFVEMSPHPVLTPAVEEIRRAAGQNGIAVGSQRREQAERQGLLESLGALWAQGHPVRWERLFPEGGLRVPLPTYPWQRERYWIEAPQSDAQGPRGRAHAGGHPLLGEGQTLSTMEGVRLWETTLDRGRLPWLVDHAVQGAIVWPGAGYLEMALAAGVEALGERPLAVTDATFVEALVFLGDRVAVQVVTTEEQPGRLRFRIASKAPGGARASWTVHARGALLEDASVPRATDLAGLRARLCVPGAAVPAGAAYTAMAEMGLEYGPAFQGLVEVWRGDGEALGRVRLPEAAGPAAAYRIHPALLDACFQVMAVTLLGGEKMPWMPVEVRSLRLHRRPVGELWCHVCLAPSGGGTPGNRRSVDVLVVDGTGAAVAEVTGLIVQQLASTTRRSEQDDWFLELGWEPAALPAPKVSAGRFLLLGDGGGLGAALRAALLAAGHAVVHAVANAPGAVPEGSWPVDDSSTAGVRALLGDAFGGQAPTAVVHLRSLEGGGALTAPAIEAAIARGPDSALCTVQALAGMGYRDAPRLWLVTRGAQAAGNEDVAAEQAPLLGLARVIAMEHPELRCACVDLDPARPEREVEALLGELVADDAEQEIALRGDERRVARLTRKPPEADRRERTEPARGRPFRLQIDGPGSLDNLLLRAAPRRAPGPGDVEIAVEAAGLNFLDVLLALGVMPDDARAEEETSIALGVECSGRVVALGEGVSGLALGQPVIALARGALATHVTTRAALVMPRPEAMSSVDAAASPSVFLTAWYALDKVARLRRGERVLIHAAAGGVGLAAVQWAQRVGAEIYATAGSPEKRAYLESLGVRYVSDSRSDRFVGDILSWTGGEGVDVVLNSLSGDLIEKSFSLLRSHGRFVELGKRDYYANNQLGLRPFLRNLSFSLVDLRGMMRERPAWVRELLEELLDLFCSGALRPLPAEVSPISRAADAFHKMARGQHIGKLVLTLEEPEVRIHLPLGSGVTIRHDGSYLVTGGLGGLGLSVAGWLADRGAGHIVLAGRSGARSAEQQAAVAALSAAGVRVTVAQADVSRRDDVQRVLDEIAASAMPLRGVIHAAALLSDGLLPQQDRASLRAVMAPKILGALHLHELTRDLPLDLFVMYASGAGLIGSPGQGNYAAANTFLDALAHRRRSEGLPALSIDWGAFSEVGLAAAQENRGARLASRGLRSMTPDEGLEALGRLLDGAAAQAAVLPLDVRQWVELYPAAASSRLLSRLMAEQPARADRDPGARALRDRLAAAEPGARAALFVDFLRGEVSRVLRIAEDRLDVSEPLTGLGMDSLMGLELRNRIEAVLGVRMPATLLWTYPTVSALGRHLSSAAGVGVASAAPEHARKEPAMGEQVSVPPEMSDEDLMSALRAEL